MQNIKNFTFEQLRKFITDMGQPKYRAGQIFTWLAGGAEDFTQMTNLPKLLQSALAQRAYVSVPKIEKKLVSTDGTVKYLWRLGDDNFIESVIMQYKHGLSVCVSTQVGCNMGCKFCASAIGGKVRDLGAGEILDQIIFAEKDLGKRISNVVLMGMGEPLDNYDQVVAFLQNAGHEKGLNISFRHMVLSTCGLCDKIEQLGQLKLPITLSVSLHAPDNDMRNSIMQINNKYPIETLMDCCRRYIETTGRRISFEYTLIDGQNDSTQCAKKLADLLGGMLCHVNLIPVNRVEETTFEKSRPQNVQRFLEVLLKNRINATVRRELGSDIAASCGQLRKKQIQTTS